MFATFNFLPHTRLIPIQKIKMEPMSDRYAIAVTVIIGEINFAKSVIAPSKTKTGIAENTAPFPMEEVITAIMIQSRTDLTASVE